MRRLLLPALAVVLVLAGCRGEPDQPIPTPEPSAAPELHALATLAVSARFDATYRFTARATAEAGTIRLRQRPPEYRLDISLTRSASYFALRGGIVSCTRKKTGKGYSCFLVARRGEPVPDLFDPGVQRLFHDAVADLAAHPDDYDVRSAPPFEPEGLPPSRCFQVQRIASPSPRPSAKGSPAPGFETGEYCFTEDGVPSRFDVATGSLVMTKLGGVPTSKDFKPPAKYARLPTLSPSPSPSRA